MTPILPIEMDASKWAATADQLRARLKLADDRQHAWDDPAWFANEYLGRPTFDKQNEIAESLKVNRRTAVKGANSSGKDYESGNIVPWWEFCWDDSIVIVYGPTMRQVRDIIWREARRAFMSAAARGNWLPGYMYPKAPKYFIDEYRYAEGFSASPDDETGSGIQGFHSPHTLLIVTEAHAVETAEIEALIRLNPYRVLLTGNTLVQSGEFFDAFYTKSWIYNGITIAAADTPNIIAQETVVPGMIIQEDVDETAQEYGVDSAMYRARILAEFPDNLEDAVVSRKMLAEAVARGLEAEDADDGEVLPRASLACDVARFGDDDTVVYRRQGRHNYMAWWCHGRDLMQIAGKLRQMAFEDPDVDTIVIDDTGLGGGVTDALRQTPVLNKAGKTVRIIAFRGGSRAVNKKRYLNLVTEAWMEAARAFRPGDLGQLDDQLGDPPTITLDNQKRLLAELSSRQYIIHSDARLKLEEKKDFKKRARFSPDYADAFTMNYSPLVTRGWGVLK